MSIDFKLQNGLLAMLYPSLEELPKLYRLCAKLNGIMHDHQIHHCVVKVKLNKESIWLIFYWDFSIEEYIKSQLRTNLAGILDHVHVYLAIYRNRVYEATKPDIDLILESVKNKTSPTITVVLQSTNEKRNE